MNAPLQMFLETFALIFGAVVIACFLANLVDSFRIAMSRQNDE